MTQKLALSANFHNTPESDAKKSIAHREVPAYDKHECFTSGSQAMDEAFKTDISEAVNCLKSGGIILYPTDTVWGLGCDATCADAVERIFKLKRRVDSKAMLSITDSMATLAKHVGNQAAEKALALTSAYKPRPVTIVMDNACGLAPQLMSEDGSAAFRLTAEKFSGTICRELGHPVVSSSANISGRPTPALFHEIDKDITDGVDYVVKYRQDDETRHKPSKIIKLNADGTITTIRE